VSIDFGHEAPVRRETKLREVMVRVSCPDCDVELEHNKLSGSAVMLTVNPPVYMHQCPACRRAFRLDRPYPAIEYEEVK